MILETLAGLGAVATTGWGWRHRHLRYGKAAPWRHYGTVVAPQRGRLPERRRLVIGRSLTARHTAVWGKTGSGKCVAAFDSIYLADGSRVCAGDLIDQTFQIMSLVDDQPRVVNARAEFNAIEPVYCVTTDSGKRITRSGNHPLFHARTNGPKRQHLRWLQGMAWCPVDQIQPGDLVAVPTRLFTGPISFTMPDDRIKLIAYLLGDGGFTQNAVVFTQLPGPQLDEWRDIVTRMGCFFVDRGTYGHGIVCARGQRHANKGRNAVINLLRVHGMLGKHSRDKRVPGAIFQLGDDQIATFLSRLFATDGWASVYARPNREHQYPQIGFCSASRGLVEDIQTLLLRLGIQTRVERKARVNAWNLVLSGPCDIVTFAEQVGIFGKEAAVDQAAHAASVLLASSNRQFWRRRDLPAVLRWERVVSVEYAGHHPTVAIEVPETQTYLSIFYEHNSYLAAHIARKAVIEGRSLVVLDPHATMLDLVLMGAADDLMRQGVVLLYPGSGYHRIVPWNPLYVPAGETPQRVAGRFMGACARMWNLSMERTPRIWSALSMSSAALAAAGWTPLEIVRFLEDARFRGYICKHANLDFVTAWAEKFNDKTDLQQEELVESTIGRFRMLATTPVLQHLVGFGITDGGYRAAFRARTGRLPAPPADLATAVNVGAHLLVALPEAIVGEYQFFVAALILDAVVRAVQTRDPKALTVHTDLVIDEIGRLASLAPNLVTVLAEGRKYGCVANVFGQGRYQAGSERLQKELDGNTAIKLFGQTDLTEEAAAAGRMASVRAAREWEERVRKLREREFLLVTGGQEPVILRTPEYRLRFAEAEAYALATAWSPLPSIAIQDAAEEMAFREMYLKTHGYDGADSTLPAPRPLPEPRYLDDVPGATTVQAGWSYGETTGNANRARGSARPRGRQ